MSKSVNASRIVGLLVLLMAAIVALSGPVAEVLDPGSEPVAEAKKKHKKKKKKKKKPFPFNVVQCPTSGVSTCDGTEGNDFLIGRDEFDRIEGKAGTDVYQGKNGGDVLDDDSLESSDFYLLPATEFGGNVQTLVGDDGGSADLVDLRSYSIEDFEVKELVSIEALSLDGPGNRTITFADFFDSDGGPQGKIETFLFREGSFTGDQVASRATNATAEEEAALKERLSEEEQSSSSGDVAQEEKKKEASSS